MPWCPVCKVEYLKGFIKCKDCGMDLIDKLESRNELHGPAKNDGYENRNGSFCGETLLTNIIDPVELTYLTSMFEDEGIAYRVIDGDVGQYLQIIHGSSFIGKAVFVRKDDYDRAADIYGSYKAGSIQD